MTRTALVLFFLAVSGSPLVGYADGPGDNDPLKVRRVPRLGIELSESETAPLLKRAATVDAEVAAIAKRDARLARFAPDVLVFTRSVREAIQYQEFFDKRDLNVADQVLNEAERRAKLLGEGATPWTTANGLIVRGFVSPLDGTIQPLGLIVPKSHRPSSGPRRLDIWFHGRGETVSEMRFIHQRMRNAGVFQPSDAFVLHPYGRYSNAFKFAGEVDTLEALEFVQRQYSIDADRISVRGFSMGGAGCWQFAVHYADRWFAANPGAGFSETPEFLRFFQKETLNPVWWERDLWRWYDCTDWSPNLLQCPTVAYSGELDIQKQAADIMAQSLDSHGMKLTHVIGPKTKHSYHPAARDEVERRMTAIAKVGRVTPRSVKLVTYTLKYNTMHWLQVDGLEEHWRRGEVAARIVDDSIIHCDTKNVSALTISTPPGWRALKVDAQVKIAIDGQRLTAGTPETDRSFKVALHKVEGRWKIGAPKNTGLRKRPGLQGPIDDALMSSFLFVEPTRPAKNPAIDHWTKSEWKRAKQQWRLQFRGHARSKPADQVSDDDIARHNLILWGDPSSNPLMAKVVEQLPIRWTQQAIAAGDERFDADKHVLLMVYPNPLNPERYVVFNSSATYREYAYLNNARQTPKLPDWAVVEVTEKPHAAWPLSRWPGKIVGANFFDEQWRLREPKPVDSPPASF